MSEATAENAPEEVTLAEENVEPKEAGETSESELILLEESSRNFRYPLDMKDKDHPGTIEFESYIIEGLNISEKISSAFSAILRGRNSFRNEDDEESSAGNELTNEEKQALEEQITQVSGSLATMENLEGGTPNGRVTLPLQANLAFNDGATYQGADLGVIAGGLESAMNSEGSFTLDDGNLSAAGAALAAQKLSGLAGEAIGAVAGGLGGRGLIGAGIGAVAGSNLLDQLPNAVSSATRYAPSPNERILFKRVMIRKFTFGFKMVAFSEEEAKEIKNIITFFRTEMYPERVELSTGNDLPLAYKFPNVFKIRIKNRSGLNPAYNIQRCYLESIQTNFNATAPTLYRGDYFMEVDIGLNFTEVSALHKKRIRDGY